MATSYPTGLDSFDAIGASDEMNDEVGTRTHREMHNDANDAIEAIEAELGTSPSGSYDTVAARLAASDPSALLVKANNLSDLASAETARTNLGLGTMATAAASDYLSKAGNLAGLADLPTARTNLGLGTAAVADTGTGAGTVAAGDDSRLTDARTPTDGSVSTVKIVDGAVTPIKVGSRYVAKTSAYTLTAADEVVDCTSGTFTVTLPSAAGVAGRMFTVKNSGTGVITIGRTSSQTIDGVNANVVLGGKGSFTVLSTGAAWIVIQGSYTDESVGRRIFTWDQVNGRWQMTYGDTGWRDVTANLINSWTTGPGGWVRMRRINNTVHLSSYYVVGSGASSYVMMLQIAGFMSNPGNVTRIPIVDNTTVRVMTVAAGASFIFTEYASIVDMSLNGVSWIADDAWPSSLPGTAVGSIPT